MKKMLFALGAASLLNLAPAWAHGMMLAVNDNGDGSVTVESTYSSGRLITDAEIRLESPEGEVLWRGETDAEGKLTFKKPAVTYVIVLDGGAGHRVEEKGPP